MTEKKPKNYKHGHSRRTKGEDRIYSVWLAMRNRCSNPKHKQYPDYGGRGIYVCEEWNDFTKFLEDMGNNPKDMQIERINNDGPYCKENCCWADKKNQANNRRSTKYHIENNIKMTRQEFLKEKRLTKEQLTRIENKKRYEENGLPKRIRKGTYHDVGSCSRNKDHPLHPMYKSWGYIKTHSSGMSDSWEDFNRFVEDMGQKPKELRLLRRNTKESFCKENCYWG